MLYSASLLLAGVALPLPLAAQAVVQPLPGTTDADKLADLVRQIGRNPRDVGALVDAGDLSAKLGDTTAAASLYKRASQVDPNNARVQAGIARILVNGEHPGEALRYFNQAERAGLSAAMFADDRGLAYDLIGEQERAQRDYRLALAQPGQDNEDEVRRRYALSLGISGRKDEALQQIDALLRKSDRGAWRARAFILAMNGDASGANHIASTMMPAGMATGLAAFFTRLPTLSPADRAFAVHFGEVTPTPERIADARLVPPLPALAPDSYARPAGVQLAARTVAAPAAPARGSGRGREARQVAAASRGRSSVPAQVATAVPPATLPQSTPPVTQVAQAPAPSRPAYAPQATTTQPSASTQVAATTAPAFGGAASLPAPAASSPTQVAQTLLPARPTYSPSPGPVSVAAQPAPAPTRTANALNAAQPSYAAQPVGQPVSLAAAAEARTIVPSSTASVAAAGSPASSAAQANNALRSQSPAALVAASPTPSAAPVSGIGQANTPVALAATAASSTSISDRPPASSVATPASVQLAAATTAAPPLSPHPTTPARIENEDTILARIVANISIPASELGVAPMPGATPAPGSTATIDDAAIAAERNAAAVERRRDRAVATAPAPTPRARHTTPVETAAVKEETDPTSSVSRKRAAAAPSRDGRRATAGKEEVAQVDTDDAPAGKRRGSAKNNDAVEPKLTPRQAAAKAKADAKALADAKAAAAEKKAAAAEKKAARAEPERYWVQVAGGATQGDLHKAWKNVRTKSSLLASRTGYTTPLRATNRVVTGPFKTQDEAQAMVNKLSKDGVSAFTFTSEAGQKMTKLGEK